MQPLLKPGDIILVDPNAYDLRSPTKGDIVVAWHPYWTDLRMIKRVRVFHPDGSVALAGDNPEESTDFDTIALDKIFGQVTSKIG